MAERKAVNKYYPPEWTPQQGSINKFRGTHALRERARKLHMGILIIRFEMPFNIWCNGCENHIGMGVRYNAEKTKVGMYYTTPIYKFRMKCHLCTNHFEIQTDPQNLDYVILNGARRQERRWDPSENEQVAPDEKDVSKKLALDAMYRLEHGVNDKAKQKSVAPTLLRLEEYQERWKDDYELNKALRKGFREERKRLKAEEAKDKAILTKYSLDVNLLPESSDDVKLAGLLKLNPLQSMKKQQEIKREEIISRPLFPVSQSPLTNKIRIAKSPDAFLVKESIIEKTFSHHLSQLVAKSREKKGQNMQLQQHSAKNASFAEAKESLTKETSNSLVAFDYGSSSEDD